MRFLPFRRTIRDLAAAVLAGLMPGLLGLAPQAIAQTAPAAAQAEDAPTSGLLNPFPEGDIYRLVLIGDDFASGLMPSLAEALAQEPRVQVQRKTLRLDGIIAGDVEAGAKSIEEAGAKSPIDIAVVMVGIDDHGALRNAAGRRIAPGSDEWRDAYGRRIERIVSALKRIRAVIFWVGLPIERRSDWSEDNEQMNDVIREKTTFGGGRYVDIWTSFQDDGGGYNSRGPDLTGKIQVLRDSNGVEFTEAGNRKLAHFVARELSRDLAQARSERIVPLVGGEPEQRKIAALRPAGTPAAPAAGSATPAARDPRSATYVPALGAKAPTAAPGDGQKLDTSTITITTRDADQREKTTTLTIVRPAISATVLALLNRRDQPGKPAALGDSIIRERADGLVTIDTIAPASELLSDGRRSRQAPTQTPFFRVLVKGELLPPRPGRSDDFLWPRDDAAQLPPPASQGAERPAAAPTDTPTPSTGRRTRTRPLERP